ncbi:spore coat protein [Ammoniphilus oxalaticus]|uniref:Spore coat protein n=1 Tax=Ammoniphilus oxalaticus TaxID=66863 RepID=A0A419SK02_9BACL|nr:outer spore coat protein CotE [Ammoniphilus oxalaticus]RKD24307.1 spore coat protein [Ammoniphilus oxalaticus]
MPSTDKEMQCREIITRAVCGKGRKFSGRSHTITPKQPPSEVLGCWIINHKYEADKVGDVIEVTGSYDVQIWVSYNDNTDTAVIKETVTFVESVPLSFYDDNCRGKLEVYAQATQQPNCLEAKLVGDGRVVVKVETEYAVEVVGETKLCVVICDSCDDDEKDFDFGGLDDVEEFDELEFDEDFIDDLD